MMPPRLELGHMPSPEPITEGACTLGAVWGRGGHPSKVEALLGEERKERRKGTGS